MTDDEIKEIWSKEVLFQSMPDIRVGNDDGTEMQWRWRDGEWTWKHVRGNEVLQEGFGPP